MLETQNQRTPVAAQKTETVNRRLKRLRLAAGMSQRDLASPGVTYAYISRIEAGARTPSVKALRKLAAKLGVTVEYLETGASETLTDQLLRDADHWTNGTPVRVTIVPHAMRHESPTAVFLRYKRNGVGHRTAQGATLTEALLEMRRREQDLDRLLAEQAEIEQRLAASR